MKGSTVTAQGSWLPGPNTQSRWQHSACLFCCHPYDRQGSGLLLAHVGTNSAPSLDTFLSTHSSSSNPPQDLPELPEYRRN